MAQRCDASKSGAWLGVTANLAVVFGIAAFTVGVIATGLGVLDPAGHVLPGYAFGWALPERKILRAPSRPVNAADCCAKSRNTAPFDPAPTDRPRNDRAIVAPHADEYRGKTEPLRCEDDLREFLVGTAARNTPFQINPQRRRVT